MCLMDELSTCQNTKCGYSIESLERKESRTSSKLSVMWEDSNSIIDIFFVSTACQKSAKVGLRPRVGFRPPYPTYCKKFKY